MTAKEKAKEIFNKFFNQMFDHYNAIELAKQCALIAIKEMLHIAFFLDDETYPYLQEVRAEIEKL